MTNLYLFCSCWSEHRFTDATTITTTSPDLIDDVAEVGAAPVYSSSFGEVFVAVLNKN
jgi:hypothetical protein